MMIEFGPVAVDELKEPLILQFLLSRLLSSMLALDVGVSS